MNVGLVCERLKRIFGLILLQNGNFLGIAENSFCAFRISDHSGIILALVCLVVVAKTKQINGSKVLWYPLPYFFLAIEDSGVLNF